MGKIIGMILGGIAAFNGIGILSSDTCQSVSFSGEGGGRVMAAQCFADNSGAIPGTVAGLGLVVIGGAIAAFSFLRS
jgi:hypothetical protein